MLPCAGIDKLQFQPNGDISGMVSAEGELVPLKTRIKPSAVGGAVERWLIQVSLLALMPPHRLDCYMQHCNPIRSDDCIAAGRY